MFVLFVWLLNGLNQSTATVICDCSVCVRVPAVYAILPPTIDQTTATSDPAVVAADGGGEGGRRAGGAIDKAVNAPTNDQNRYSSDQLPESIVDSADRFSGGLDVENNTGGITSSRPTV